jgi:hypothetical protein
VRYLLARVTSRGESAPIADEALLPTELIVRGTTAPPPARLSRP